jgi:hypothetical protein
MLDDDGVKITEADDSTTWTRETRSYLNSTGVVEGWHFNGSLELE